MLQQKGLSNCLTCPQGRYIDIKFVTLKKEFPVCSMNIIPLTTAIIILVVSHLKKTAKMQENIHAHIYTYLIAGKEFSNFFIQIY